MTSNWIARTRVAVGMALLVLGLGACAEPANHAAMTIEQPPAGAPPTGYRGAIVTGAIDGGRETSPVWKSNIGNDQFREALARSLLIAGLGNSTSGRYRFDADLLRLDQPFLGFDLTVTASVRYRLVESTTGTVVYDSTITTPFTAPFSASFIAVARLKIANEGAARANIARLIEELYALPGAPVARLRS